MPPSNIAAYLTSFKSTHLEVKSAPYTSPKSNEIVVRNRALAINPIYWVLKEQGNMAFPWLKPPCILGSDVAGEVVEVGPGATDYKVGDRVVGHAVALDKEYNTPSKGAFQQYTVLLAHMTSHIPNNLSYENASVIPLGLSTAACGLFQEDQLALQYPTAPAQQPTRKTVLIWGGSTSVGSNAIQLAVAAGYEVFTTSSPRNFDYVKRLGASQVFDYKRTTVVKDVIRALEGKTTAGAFSIGAGAADACMDILDKCQGNKFIAMASYPVPQPPPEHMVLLQTASMYISWMVINFFKSRARGIRYKFIFGSTLVDNGVGKACYVDFLPEALAEGTYIAAPDPLVVGKGLENIDTAFDVQKKGMSTKKVVVFL